MDYGYYDYGMGDWSSDDYDINQDYDIVEEIEYHFDFSWRTLGRKFYDEDGMHSTDIYSEDMNYRLATDSQVSISQFNNHILMEDLESEKDKGKVLGGDPSNLFLYAVRHYDPSYQLNYQRPGQNVKSIEEYFCQVKGLSNLRLICVLRDVIEVFFQNTKKRFGKFQILDDLKNHMAMEIPEEVVSPDDLPQLEEFVSNIIDEDQEYDVTPLSLQEGYLSQFEKNYQEAQGRLFIQMLIETQFYNHEMDCNAASYFKLRALSPSNLSLNLMVLGCDLFKNVSAQDFVHETSTYYLRVLGWILQSFGPDKAKERMAHFPLVVYTINPADQMTMLIELIQTTDMMWTITELGVKCEFGEEQKVLTAPIPYSIMHMFGSTTETSIFAAPELGTEEGLLADRKYRELGFADFLSKLNSMNKLLVGKTIKKEPFYKRTNYQNSPIPIRNLTMRHRLVNRIKKGQKDKNQASRISGESSRNSPSHVSEDLASLIDNDMSERLSNLKKKAERLQILPDHRSNQSHENGHNRDSDRRSLMIERGLQTDQKSYHMRRVFSSYVKTKQGWKIDAQGVKLSRLRTDCSALYNRKRQKGLKRSLNLVYNLEGPPNDCRFSTVVQMRNGQRLEVINGRRKKELMPIVVAFILFQENYEELQFA